MPLDQFDAAILKAVQKNNRLTSDELGELVHLSGSACQRRLKRLRTTNIIEADVSIISPKSLGRPLTMIILVSLERERIDIIDTFKRAVKNCEEIMMCFYITGDADFILIVTAKDMEDYEQFTRRFLYSSLDVKAVKTMVAVDWVKVGFEFPIDVDGMGLADPDGDGSTGPDL